MSFLSPMFLAGAAAAVIPLILHLLKREPEARVKFAAVRMLKDAPVEQTQSRSLRQLLLLALRMAALVLLALAFARPFFADGRAADAGVTVVALDRSYSMSSPGRFERAKQAAHDAVAKAPAGDLIGVIAFDDVAEVLAAPSSDRVLANGAIDRAAAGFGGTRYRAAISAAGQMLSRSHGSIEVVTDLQESGWSTGDQAAVPASTTIDVLDMGAVPDNLAVAGVRSAGDRLVATIRNSSSRARDARVSLTVDDGAAAENTVSIAPNDAADVVFPLAAGGVSASVTVDDPEGLQADNIRYALLSQPGVSPLLVITTTGDLEREAFYARAAIEAAAPGAGSFKAAGVGASQLAGWTDERMAAQTVVLLLSTQGLERRGRDLVKKYVQAGGGVLIAAGPDVDGEVVADLLGDTALKIEGPAGAKPANRTLAPADMRHPVFQAFGANAAALGTVTFRQVAGVSGSGCRALARFTTGETALIDCAAGAGRALVFGSDLDNRWNDFPIHPAFVPFVHEAMKYLAAARVQPSEYLVGAAPGVDARRPGIISIPDTSNPAVPRKAVVNVDPRESDPARIGVDAFQAAVTRVKEEGGASPAHLEVRDQEDRQHLWEYVLGAMFLLLAAEGVVAGRTA